MLLGRSLAVAAFGRTVTAYTGQTVLGSSKSSAGTSSNADYVPLDGSDAWSGLADYTRATLDRWHVVGTSVAIRDGRKNQTWAQGFGYADLSTKEPVTPSTMFFTGSTTKSFTAAALSLLIDNSTSYSNIQWTTPISQLLPGEFVLSDSWATEHITIEDALTHRTGLPRHDLAWVPTMDESIHNLRHLPMSSSPPRTKYQYSNKMYAVAGYIVERLTSLPLSEFFTTHLFKPMNMTSTYLGYHNLPNHTTTSQSSSSSSSSLARSYHYRPSTNSHIPIPYELHPADYPAGDIISTVLDYTSYLTTLLNHPSTHPQSPFSPSGHRELFTPRILVSLTSPPYDGPQFYCLGWDFTTFHGETVYHHTGAVQEFISIMLFIPSRDFSIVVFGNTQDLSVLHIAYRALYDAFDVPEGERIDFDQQLAEKKRMAQRDLEECPGRIYPDLPEPRLRMSLGSLQEYQGTFENEGYGTVFVKLHCDGQSSGNNRNSSSTAGETGADDDGDDGECRLRMTRREDEYPHIIGEMVHQSGEYWLAWGYVAENQEPERPVGCLRAEFRIGANGQVSEFGFDFRMEGEDVPLMWFKKVAGV